ncbi:MAG: bifunctional nuclease family protein [Candidatus Nanopelagicales bacterium]
MRQVSVSGIRMIEASNEIVLLLSDERRQLPIWIGSPEAAAIALSQQGYVPSRPLTHDLLLNVLEALGAPCERVEVTSLVDGVFYADLVLASGQRVACRPSDAVAIALRAKAPILVADEVLDAAAVVEAPSEDEVDVDAFRAFLDEVSPEDFGQA